MRTTNSPGFDYGRIGGSNRDHETGIHYGIIPLSALNPDVIEDFEADYGKPCCPECGTETTDILNSDIVRCGTHGEIDSADAYPEDPISWTYEAEGYALSLDDSGDVWVFKAPFFTHAAFCSPCAPGAGYLTSPCEDGPKTYCLGADWFDKENPMPYVANPIV